LGRCCEAPWKSTSLVATLPQARSRFWIAMLKQLLAAAAALTLAAPIAAQAQEVPSYASAPADQQIQGRVTAFDGAYDLTVLDNSGYSDNIQLHDGTIINPVGLTLEPGMIVNVLGYNAGPVFDANEIDTPYRTIWGIPGTTTVRRSPSASSSETPVGGMARAMADGIAASHTTADRIT